MVNHYHSLITITNHGQPCYNITLWQILSQYENQPWSTMFVFPFKIFIIGLYTLVYNIYLKVYNMIFPIWKSTMVNNSPRSHCDKNYLNMKINHGQPWSNIALRQRLCLYENQSWSTLFILGFIIFILGFMYLRFIILIPWVYNINLLGLILFPCVFSNNPLGL